MIQLTRTDSSNKDFRSLVALLDKDLAQRDGGDHAFYSQYNKVDAIRNVVVLYKDNMPVACGAFKPFSDGAVEIKRMYVPEARRRQGFAAKVVAELESWAAELGYQSCVLETGKRQPEAIALYHKLGYHNIPNFGQYIGVDNSVCMEKRLS